LNEAMAAGVAPVVSDDVGAAADLIDQGRTGFVFPTRDWRQMQQYVTRLVTDATLRAEIGSAAAAMAMTYSYEASVNGILEALSSLGVYRMVHGAA
jgi:glycosyltransferase involved in cell wall biosynthesis